eukprot:gb/GECH01011178.1/.p1 GENE.gb/GECH01011178.1/~~gb/GECH01011178.1/.p1  ORF type:complete len:123 (+),score=19.06 gb/GECH01011178.1/:1-369(+)
MSAVNPKKKQGLQAPAEKEAFKKIRITLCSRNVKSVENVCATLVGQAKDSELRVKGPVRLPTKYLRITSRKSPCGQGTNTWDRYEMRIHKRYIDINGPSSVVKEITTFSIKPDVTVEVTLTN